jgi:hypothetical protein
MAPVIDAVGLGCGLPISARKGASYLKLLPYPGLLARPRRGFPRALGVEVFRVFPQFDSVACYAQTSISATLS